MARPEIGPEELEAVAAVMRSGQLAQGAKVAELEAGFARLCGTKHAVAVNSGTAALHAALHAAGVGPGDEVIVPALSFVATANVVLMQGAVPVFVDVREDDFNLDPARVERVLTPKTKAIIAVDLYGQPYDYAAVKVVAGRHQLALIEDAAQAVGAKYKGRPAGSLGDYGCFSLYATKNITSGEGGVLVTNSDEGDRSARAFRHHGQAGTYKYEGLGYNYRLTDVLAAIAVVQLKKSEKFSRARGANAAALSEGLAGVRGLVLPQVLPGRTHVFHQYTVRVTEEFGMSRDDLATKLKERGIATGIFYPEPLPIIPHLNAGRYHAGDFPVAEQLSREVLSLPVHPGLSRYEVDRIVEAVT